MSKNVEIRTDQILVLGMRHAGRISGGRHDEYAKIFANLRFAAAKINKKGHIRLA